MRSVVLDSITSENRSRYIKLFKEFFENNEVIYCLFESPLTDKIGIQGIQWILKHLPEDDLVKLFNLIYESEIPNLNFLNDSFFNALTDDSLINDMGGTMHTGGLSGMVVYAPYIPLHTTSHMSPSAWHTTTTSSRVSSSYTKTPTP